MFEFIFSILFQPRFLLLLSFSPSLLFLVSCGPLNRLLIHTWKSLGSESLKFFLIYCLFHWSFRWMYQGFDLLLSASFTTLFLSFGYVFRGMIGQLFEAQDITMCCRHSLSLFCIFRPVFMNELDRSLINFHFANLEYGNGTSLFNSSMKDWNQDDDYEFEGPHCMGSSLLKHSILFFPGLHRNCCCLEAWRVSIAASIESASSSSRSLISSLSY